MIPLLVFAATPGVGASTALRAESLYGPGEALDVATLDRKNRDRLDGLF
jgi:hypothetical protein